MPSIAVNELFEPYTTLVGDLPCYMAGMPSYARNFSRDTLLAGIIANDAALLYDQLQVSCSHQGKETQALTGEELGKIHHEYPGVIWRTPYFTTYNACDTTALYLIGIEALWHLDHEIADGFMREHKKSIFSALEYLNNHIRDAIFWEFPPAGAPQFSLHITYWKDSIIPDPRGSKEPAYPVAFALVQFQVARALLAASMLLSRDDLARKADEMFKAGIAKFITKDSFCILQDAMYRLEQPSSDELHSLAYIPQSYIPLLPTKAIMARAESLVTPAGIACSPRDIGLNLSDTYHGYKVWPFEQALIHYGCRKFGFDSLAHMTERCKSYVGEGQELLALLPAIAPAGNGRQLWSVAAKIYFSDKRSLRKEPWL